MRAFRTLLLMAALAGIRGCDQGDAADNDRTATAASSMTTESGSTSPPAASVPTVPPSSSDTPAVQEQPAHPVPFDAEAEARARAEAARAAFEAEWPMHGVAYHFLAQVRARPDASSPVVGYLRRGSRFRAKAAVRGPGCPRGWHEVVGGGFVCRGEGFLLGEVPQQFEPSPVPAALEDALPYVYAYVVRDDVPQYWRIPTPSEERETAALLVSIRAGTGTSSPGGSPERGHDGGLPYAVPAAGADAGLERRLVPVGAVPDAGVGGSAPFPEYLRMRMLRGFYVSVDRELSEGERRFFRTVRGTYVPAEALVEASPPSMRGVILGGEWQPPIAFVYQRGVRALVRDPVSGALIPGAPVPYHAPLRLEEAIIERRGARFRNTREGWTVRESALRIVPIIGRPAGIRPDERWIHVDLSEQTLVAYEGDRAVFATLVSTGRPGFETPVGTFRIQSKHVSATMDDPDSPTEAYSIEDVPWTMYFHESYALHGAFWHDSFGRVRSHGCVNLAPADARWLFQWTSPVLPPGWHGVIASSRRAGTWVHITP